MFVQRNIVTRSHNHCRLGNATVCSVFIVEPLMSLSTLLTVLVWQYNTAVGIVLFCVYCLATDVTVDNSVSAGMAV